MLQPLYRRFNLRYLNNNHGASIIQIMVVSAISIVIITYILATKMLSTVQNKMVASDIYINSIGHSIRSALMDTLTCTATFGGASTSGTLVTQVKTIKDNDLTKTPRVIFDASNVIETFIDEQIKFVGLKYEYVAGTAPAPDRLKVWIQFQKYIPNTKNAAGDAPLTRVLFYPLGDFSNHIAFYAKESGGNITYCGPVSPGLVDFCLTTGGEYNYTYKHCNYYANNIAPFNIANISGSCPDGWTDATQMQDNYMSIADSTPEGSFVSARMRYHEHKLGSAFVHDHGNLEGDHFHYLNDWTSPTTSHSHGMSGEGDWVRDSYYFWVKGTVQWGGGVQTAYERSRLWMPVSDTRGATNITGAYQFTEKQVSSSNIGMQAQTRTITVGSRWTLYWEKNDNGLTMTNEEWHPQHRVFKFCKKEYITSLSGPPAPTPPDTSH